MIPLLIPKEIGLKKGQSEKYENGCSLYEISHNLAHSSLNTLFQGKLLFGDAEMSNWKHLI